MPKTCFLAGHCIRDQDTPGLPEKAPETGTKFTGSLMLLYGIKREILTQGIGQRHRRQPRRRSLSF